ncbi:unnamed protein product [Rodentolepis nana]|uniref:Ovule protein n=1 Tax=Rodentolepis nana TaxID=102285 RepID=A0A0R3TKF5_RODNA|nr:unnamed protein product [Rodentolepis nana]
MTDTQGFKSHHEGEENKVSMEPVNNIPDKNDNQISEFRNTIEEPLPVGPLSQEDSERLQREANEETTNSEDLRLFLQVKSLVLS